MARTSTLIYGQPGTGKTALLYSFLKWMRVAEPNAVARLVSCENWATIQDAITKGHVVAWNINKWAHPFETLKFAAMGYWPEDVNDPKSKLVPPNEDTWKVVGATFFEGLSTFGDYMLEGYAPGGMAHRAAQGEDIKAREDSARFSDGQFKIGGNARTDYNIVQREMHGIVLLSHDLPCHLVWTSHETQGADDFGNLIMGPEIVGDAATKRVPRWFANCLHTMVIQDKADTKHVLFTRSHFDPDRLGVKVPFKAKHQIRDRDLVPLALSEGENTMVKFMDLVSKHSGIPAPVVGYKPTITFQPKPSPK